MQSQTQSRKRPAPGASPIVPQQATPQRTYYPMQLPDHNGVESTDQFLNWNDGSTTTKIDPGYSDAAVYDANANWGNANGALQSVAARLTPEPQQSTQLVRRNANQQLTTRGRGLGQWQDFNQQSISQQPGWDNDEDEEDLEAKARAAKMEAQANRKQIPPFVQKLSSFLNEDKNTDLIRWSDDGNSFLVIDEDEFAKTLIPELFKHNNYASFVRQLNMYGFHKKVGLSDNSMNTSMEKKKTPSEYYNKYFRRGRPELLWLIQKPKSTSGHAKRKRDEQIKEDGEATENTGNEGHTDARPGDGGSGNQDMVLMPRSEISSIRSELRALQQQQKFISSMINQIRQQNEQLYQQATAFQTLHDRHENSINAILTFLATFYNRNLEGHNVKNLTDMFAHAIPQASQSHGNVVEMGDYPTSDLEKQIPSQRPSKKLLALMPAPAVKAGTSAVTRPASTPASSTRATTLSPKVPNQQQIFKPPVQGSRDQQRAPIQEVTSPTFNSSASPGSAVKTDAPTPDFLASLPESSDILSAINTANANNSLSGTEGPQLDFPAVLSHFQTAGGNSPLTAQQRNDMLALIANNQSNNTTSGLDDAANSNNALVSPHPPPMPSMDHFESANQQLAALEKLQHDTGSKLHDLEVRLNPLSPTGTIPGVNGDGNYFPPPEFDINNFIHEPDYFGDAHATADPNAGNMGFNDFDLDLPDPNMAGAGAPGDFSNMLNSDPVQGHDDSRPTFAGNDNGGGGIVESISSEATSPAGTTLEANEDKDLEEVSQNNKRRRVT